MLRHHSGRFATHYIFAFLIFNIMLEQSSQTSDKGIKELLKSLSLYGFCQPMLWEYYLSLRRKIKSLIIQSLNIAYKQARLAISDPVSLAIFFHREISLFFKHYVRVGEDSMFGWVSQYFSAIKTNKREVLYIYSLLWL
ncbi:hypothetical protein B0I35DRAFT_454672 [Stachybotrys elegans]|uniref:Helitron helicase-like domain-containing protein n=1 Tax=Stachybotrys elegans TaxID=80388 RepID=A0A8K0SHX5_9HYPO|nr:hypothetical protein B0I35DRAFT_454672 [Stachybotrys elegans]